jgi:hypothetical protein
LINIDKLIYIFYLLTPFLKIEKKMNSPCPSTGRTNCLPSLKDGFLSFPSLSCFAFIVQREGEREKERDAA